LLLDGRPLSDQCAIDDVLLEPWRALDVGCPTPAQQRYELSKASVAIDREWSGTLGNLAAGFIDERGINAFACFVTRPLRPVI
jgi:hypothetical protein